MTPIRETIARAIFETYSHSAVCKDWAAAVTWEQLLTWPGLIPDAKNPHAPSMVIDMIRDEADAVLRALDEAGAVVVPREPTFAQIKAMAESEASDHEGPFPPLFDMIGFSGEDKTRTVLVAAYRAMIAAATAST